MGLNIDKDDDGNDASKKDDKQKEKAKEPVKKNPMGEKPFLQAIEKIVKGQPITLEALKGLYELTPDQEKKITETIAPPGLIVTVTDAVTDPIAPDTVPLMVLELLVLP